MQLGPSLSPDGKQAVFFSERDRLSLDLFLADVAHRSRDSQARHDRGEREVRQPSTASLGRRLEPGRTVVRVCRRAAGKAALMLIDMRDGGRDREIVFDSIGQVLSPSWSPDGRSIAFSAIGRRLHRPLHVRSVASAELRQLTDDAFADLQPAWSHDGRTIAFVTERFSSDLDTLRFGRPQLAMLDVDTRPVRDVHDQRQPRPAQPAVVERRRGRSISSAIRTAR